MQLLKHLTANNVKLTKYDFLRELSMEAYLIENENVLILDNDSFSEIEIIDVELSLKDGRKRKNTDGRIDILAFYNSATIAIIELKLGELNQQHLNQLEDYLNKRSQIIDQYSEKLEINNPNDINWAGILVGSSIDGHLEEKIKNGYLIEDTIPVAALTISRFRGDDSQIYVLTETFFKNISRNFDRTKYKFNNEILAKNRLVLKIIKKYVEDHPNISYSELEKIFPKKLQGANYGVFGPAEEAQRIFENTGHKRHFLKSDELIKLSDNTTIAVCNQWAIANIGNVITKAESIGYNIEKIRY